MFLLHSANIYRYTSQYFVSIYIFFHFSIILTVGFYASIYQAGVHKFYINLWGSSKFKVPGRDMN